MLALTPLASNAVLVKALQRLCLLLVHLPNSPDKHVLFASTDEKLMQLFCMSQ